ncbi:MAG TPA: transposase [bacterium]
MGWNIRKRGEELYHHVYAWGNDHHPVFKNGSHYQFYLSLLEKMTSVYKVDIVAYALMKWHVHLFAYDQANKIADFMMALHGGYAQYYNRDCSRTGHVFGERYNNKIVANSLYGVWLSRYIHRQALDAGLAADPAGYPWTSYRRYVGAEPRGFVKCDIVLEMFSPGLDKIQRYQEFVMGADEGPVDWDHRRLKIRDGRPLLEIIAQEFEVDQTQIVTPKGRVEKMLRRQAAVQLMGKYGLNTYETATILKMTPSAISKFTKSALL